LHCNGRIYVKRTQNHLHLEKKVKAIRGSGVTSDLDSRTFQQDLYVQEPFADSVSAQPVHLSSQPIAHEAAQEHDDHHDIDAGWNNTAAKWFLLAIPARVNAARLRTNLCSKRDLQVSFIRDLHTLKDALANKKCKSLSGLLLKNSFESVAALMGIRRWQCRSTSCSRTI
jgi:hypothetical protein